jgi:hypothetical protein
MSSPKSISPVPKATDNIKKLPDYEFMIGYFNKIFSLTNQAKGNILATKFKTAEQIINQLA